MDQTEADAFCRSVYVAAKNFYETEIKSYWDQGFQILYGPPFIQPPILFVGYQPGKGLKKPEEERAYGSEDRWPEVSEYVTERWRLATNLQNMFGPDLLARCVGLNAVFIRANSIREYNAAVSRELRSRAAKFCIDQVSQIVDAIRPKMIVAIGLETLSLFDKGDLKAIRSADGRRVLMKLGKIARREAVATLHLSGVQIAKRHRTEIADNILGRLQSAV